MAARRPQPRRAPVRRRGARPALKLLPRAHSHIRYSAPGPDDRPGVDFDAPGTFSVPASPRLGVPREADFYLCGPTAFMTDLSAGLAGWGVAADRIHTEAFGASQADDAWHCGGPAEAAAPAGGAGGLRTARVLRAQRPQRPLGSAVSKPARTFARPATCPCDGPAARESATTAKRPSSPAPSPISPTRSTRRLPAIC